MQSLEKKPTTNIEAYDLYLNGLYAEWTGTQKSFEEALRLFEMATKKDPTFALPYAASGNVHVLMGGTYLPFKEIYPKAKELVARALELDPKSSDAHVARGNFALQCDLDWKKAETELKQAILLNPGNSEAHCWYAVLLVLLQRFDEAKSELREAIRLTPTFGLVWNWLALAELLSGNIYQATALAEELVARHPTSFDQRMLVAYCYVAEGRMADALKETEKLVGPPNLDSRVGRAILFGMLGKPEEPRELVKELEERAKTTHVSGIRIASLYASLGEKEKALDLLERDFREGDKNLWLEYQYPQWVKLRNEPRFVSLLRGYKLPPLGERRPVMPHGMEGAKQPMGVPT
jgi:tetratricopeptide (TPR) repeat protein